MAHKVLIIFFLFWSLFEGPTSFANTSSVLEQKPKKWSLLFYGGMATRGPLHELIRFGPPELVSDSIIVAAANRKTGEWGKTVDLELEFQIGKHVESGGPFQLNSVFIIRWKRTPWERLFQSSFAFGNGLSFASQPPEIERTDGRKGSKLLYYISLEFLFPLPVEANNLNAFIRVHHRSGVFGLLDDSRAGSDFLTLGMRYDL